MALEGRLTRGESEIVVGKEVFRKKTTKSGIGTKLRTTPF